ncbi:hypothetical protein GCM10009017_10290 [Halarchaeum rubridurum]|uniref:Uncharacterized protein n=1 Tax=Halarchaeum rubridurum TaxID=489911 RepID=A0A830FUQ6_9EURY|nr:hypothetical protein GCM10009017_10290 [Halarchaeum rubridurum]
MVFGLQVDRRVLLEGRGRARRDAAERRDALGEVVVQLSGALVLRFEHVRDVLVLGPLRGPVVLAQHVEEVERAGVVGVERLDHPCGVLPVEPDGVLRDRPPLLADGRAVELAHQTPGPWFGHQLVAFSRTRVSSSR